MHNALYVHEVPMCLLCPQQIAQQTRKTNDGFHAEAKFGALTYGGFTCTIPYNGRNGLHIVFTTEDSRAQLPFFLKDSPSPHSPSAYAAAVLSTAVSPLDLWRNSMLLRPNDHYCLFMNVWLILILMKSNAWLALAIVVTLSAALVPMTSLFVVHAVLEKHTISVWC